MEALIESLSDDGTRYIIKADTADAAIKLGDIPKINELIDGLKSWWAVPRPHTVSIWIPFEKWHVHRRNYCMGINYSPKITFMDFLLLAVTHGQLRIAEILWSECDVPVLAFDHLLSRAINCERFVMVDWLLTGSQRDIGSLSLNSAAKSKNHDLLNRILSMKWFDMYCLIDAVHAAYAINDTTAIDILLSHCMPGEVGKVSSVCLSRCSTWQKKSAFHLLRLADSDVSIDRPMLMAIAGGDFDAMRVLCTLPGGGVALWLAWSLGERIPQKMQRWMLRITRGQQWDSNTLIVNFIKQFRAIRCFIARNKMNIFHPTTDGCFIEFWYDKRIGSFVGMPFPLCLPIAFLKEFGGPRLWTNLARALGVACQCDSLTCGCRCSCCYDDEDDTDMSMDRKREVLDNIWSALQNIDSRKGYIKVHRILTRLAIEL